MRRDLSLELPYKNLESGQPQTMQTSSSHPEFPILLKTSLKDCILAVIRLYFATKAISHILLDYLHISTRQMSVAQQWKCVTLWTIQMMLILDKETGEVASIPLKTAVAHLFPDILR